jgi:hypothetical protein
MDPDDRQQNRRPVLPLTRCFVVERVTRIELALSAWEADVLPLNYTRERRAAVRHPEQTGSSPDIVPESGGGRFRQPWPQAVRSARVERLGSGKQARAVRRRLARSSGRTPAPSDRGRRKREVAGFGDSRLPMSERQCGQDMRAPGRPAAAAALRYGA